MLAVDVRKAYGEKTNNSMVFSRIVGFALLDMLFLETCVINNTQICGNISKRGNVASNRKIPLAGEFDMRVKSCAASDGGGHVIQLSDEFGCVLRPKMISRFLKARGADERASVITYAFFHAFKFPDSLSVHIKCKVEICRHGCLDHCQLQPNKEGDVDPELLAHYVNPLERKDDRVSSGEHIMPDPLDPDLPEDILYEDVLHRDDDDETEEGPAPVKMSLNAKLGNAKRQPQFKRPDEAAVVPTEDTELDITAQPHKNVYCFSSADEDSLIPGIRSLLDARRSVTRRFMGIGLARYTLENDAMFKDIYPMPMQEKFPHGPRTFVDTVVAAPRSLDLDIPDSTATTPAETASTVGKPPKRENASAPSRRRSGSDGTSKARSADVGVSGLYEVISEADLAFSPDSRAEAVTVFQGRIREEVVYGICMPVPGFSLLFVLVAVSAVVSALVAGSLLYRYQLQKEHLAERSHRNVPMSALSGWMGLRLLRPRSAATATSSASSSGRPTTEQNGKAGEGSVVLNGKPTETRSQE
ncbi:hypothetical protein NQ318_017179 [Aromia moschata]|uniref:ZP domain-containing protein n=1 Tax=Aromia moschata TaxID=1265417 RepID=A0AAV8YQE2_9CUCU|nr:hypothetical protein NQ318_017179 [Aromia moschata]